MSDKEKRRPRRFDEEGNDVTYEQPAITAYWVENYCSSPRCDLCGNSGVIAGYQSPQYCICPNGQSMRYHRVKPVLAGKT